MNKYSKNIFLTLATVIALATGINNAHAATTAKAPARSVLKSAASLPVVSITYPFSGWKRVAGSDWSIQATASETNGTISKVEFYNNATTLLGTATIPTSTSGGTTTYGVGNTYSIAWNKIPAGNYNLTAKAYDSNGNTAISAAVTITVVGLPVTTLTVSPLAYTAPATINMTASATVQNNTLAKLLIYNGFTVLATSPANPTGPFSFTWNNVPAGTYKISARAQDGYGDMTATVPVTIRVRGAPIVAITSPANNSSWATGSNLTIAANASEIGGTIKSVSFYNGTTLLGTSTTSPYSYTATNLAAGSYTLTAQATDDSGIKVTSSPVTVTFANSTLTAAIVSPSNGNAVTLSSVNITANASESGGTLSKVSFYNGSTLLGVVTSNSQAFTYTWANVKAGTYCLTAIATDSNGVATSSLPVTMTVNAAQSSNALGNNVATQTDSLNNTTSYQYDNLNRLLKVTFADKSTVSYTYDAFGNQTSVTDQRKNTLTKVYDAYERLYQTIDPNKGITQFNYDSEGHLLTLTDANNHATTYTYDPNGRVLTQANALKYTTTYVYDPVGNVTSRQDANGKTTGYVYDALNRLTNINYPDSTSVVNVYDALSRKTTMTDATGQTSYTYDPLDRLLTKTSPGTNNTITYTYDSEGNRLTSVDQNNRTITNTYDALNRLSTVVDPNGTTSYGYDANSNKLSVASPNGVTENYTYDALNRPLSAVNQNTTGIISTFTNAYDIAGMITKKTYADGSWAAYSYDALNRLLEETKQTSSSTIYDYVYSYDLVGNRLTWTKNTTLGSFWNIDSTKMPSQVLTNMTNGGYGNTANKTQATSLTRSYTYDAANRLSNWNYAVNIYSATFPAQTDTYTYDNNGNRLTKQVTLTGQATPQQTSYSYDFENRLQNLSLPNASVGSPDTVSYTYNGEGLRTQAVLNSVASNYLYDGSNILVERDSSGNTTKTYTRGLDLGGGIGSLIAQNIPGTNPTVQYYDYNDLGSTADLTTSTGTAANSYSYDAFGNLLTPQSSSDTNRYLFSTKEFDARSGLSYFQNRYYDPEIGRWLTPDPLGFVDGVNPYLYCHNNPVNNVDPDGSISQPLIVAAGAVIGGAVEAAKYYQAFASGRISALQYAQLIGVGGATGAISTLSNGVVGGALLGGAGSAVNNAAEQQIVNGNINYNDVGTAFGTGAAVGLLGGAGTNLGGNIIKYPNLNEIYVGGSPVIDYGAAGGLIGSTLGTILTTPSGQNTAPNWAGKEGIKG